MQKSVKLRLATDVALDFAGDYRQPLGGVASQSNCPPQPLGRFQTILQVHGRFPVSSHSVQLVFQWLFNALEQVFFVS